MRLLVVGTVLLLLLLYLLMLKSELLPLAKLVDTAALLANIASIVELLDVGITCNDPRKLNPTNTSVNRNTVQIRKDDDDDDGAIVSNQLLDYSTF